MFSSVPDLGFRQANLAAAEGRDGYPFPDSLWPSMKTIAIANQKGGVGKTTTAMNLAACTAFADGPTLLIDIDPQGNATSGLGQPRPRSGGTREVLFTPDHAANAIQQTDVPGLDILPASRQLASLERDIAHLPDAPLRLRKALQPFASKYAYILIDCPPSLGILPVNALAAADSVIIPIQCEYYAMEGLAQMLELLRHVRQRYNPSLAVEGIVFTMYEPGLAYADEVAAEVRYHFDRHVYRSTIPRDMLLSEAPSHGTPIIDYAPRSIGAWSYVKLSKEVLSHGT